MSDTTTWPRQIRLPGQTAAPEGPVDLLAMYLMHHAFRRDLDAFAEAVPVTSVADAGAWRALGERWRIFADALHHHHSGEDQWLWPALRERATPQERQMLDALEAEHAQIDPLLEASAAGLHRLTQGADEDTRREVGEQLAATRDALAAHLEHEETEGLVLLQRVLSHEEWEEIDERFKQLPLRELLRLVPWALHRVPEPERTEILERFGGAYRVLWALTRPGFGRLDRRAFGATPGR